MCWLVQMLKILYLFFIRASVVRLSLIPEVSEGLELLPLGPRSQLQLSVNNLSRNGRGRRWETSQLWRDPGDDGAGSWPGQHEPHQGTSNSFHLSTSIFSSSLFGPYKNRFKCLWKVAFGGWSRQVSGTMKIRYLNTCVQAECHREWNKLNYCIAFDCH